MMLLTMLKAKLHRATVTRCELDYVGSISIDRDLMDLAGILPHEQVDVLNITNGERLTTYAIEAPRGSREFGINGAAARKAQVGDKINRAVEAIATKQMSATDALAQAQTQAAEAIRMGGYKIDL